MSTSSGGNDSMGRTGPVTGRPPAARGDPMRALLKLAEGRLPDIALLREAFRCAGTEFGAVYGLLKASHRGAAVEDYHHVGPHDPAFWKEPASRALAQSLALAQSVDVRYRSRSGPVRLAVVAAPISDGGGDPLGAMALVLEVRDDVEIERARVELRAFAAMLAMLMRPRAVAPVEQASSELRAVGAAAAASSQAGVAIAIVNQLRSKLGCEQVAIASVRRRQVRLLAISGFADVSERTPGSQAILGAMTECLDLGRAIAVSAARADGDACPLHRHWSAEAEGAGVATIPLREAGRGSTSVVLALRHVPGRQFTDEELKKIGDSVAAYPAALRVADLAHRSLLSHASDSFARHALGVGVHRGWIRLAVTLACCAALAWFSFGTMDHQVSANARIEPALVQHLTAPFAARIAGASAREGDRVHAGDVLFELDTAALAVERSRLTASIAAAGIEAETARSKGDHAGAKLVEARAEVDRALLASTERRIADATVRAPADGIVLHGDLRDRVGATVAAGESLLEFVADGSMRLVMDVAERDVLHVAPGAGVEFRPHARPDIVIHLALDRIRPAAEQHGPESVFVADAPLDHLEPWMLSGVEGAVRIDAGSGPVWWTLFHRMIDNVRLRLWL